MLKTAALAFAALLAAGPAAARGRYGLWDAPEVKTGIDYVRTSSEDGAALYEYMKQDPVEIRFGNAPEGAVGAYMTKKRRDRSGRVVDADAEIVLDESLRGRSGAEVGEVIYHEYVHRLQDKRRGLQHPGSLGHSEDEFDGAMDFLASRTGREDDLKDGDRAGFRKQFFAEGKAPPKKGGRCPKKKLDTSAFSMRAFNSFKTSATGMFVKNAPPSTRSFRGAGGARGFSGSRSASGGRSSALGRRAPRTVSGRRSYRAAARSGRGGRRFRSAR